MAEMQNQMKEHWLSRDYKTSARLYLQHWLFQNTIGYAIDPRVKSWLDEIDEGSASPICVADLACGNGAWLIELTADKSVNVGRGPELYGFDIVPSHFPCQEHIPANVQLRKRDILEADIPAELAESFDIVHIRAFGSTIKNDDISPVCEAAKRLLKPGGWFQWEEADSGNMTAVLGGKPAPRGTALLKTLEAGGSATGVTFGDLERKLEENGLVDIAFQKHPLKTHQYKAWTEDYLMAYEDLGHMLPSAKDVPNAPLSRESYEGLFASVVEEARTGMVMHSGHVWSATARKKLQ